MNDDTWQWRAIHGVAPEPPQHEFVICQVCGGPLLRGLPKHPDCEPRVVPPRGR